MKVEDIMTTEVISVQPGTSLVEVAKILRKNKIHSLPVIDENQKLVGIVTEMDFFIKDSASSYLSKWIELIGQAKENTSVSLDNEEKLSHIIDLQVQDIMTVDCVTIHPDAAIRELLDIFKETRFKSFPVVDKSGIVVGIISLVDVIKSMEL
jgi:CBS domain-containing protein